MDRKVSHFPKTRTNPYASGDLSPLLAKERERGGEALFTMGQLNEKAPGPEKHHHGEGKVPIGSRIEVGDYNLAAQEVRYWVGMTVRYEPGKPIVLASLWLCLGGMIITFIVRIKRSYS